MSSNESDHCNNSAKHVNQSIVKQNDEVQEMLDLVEEEKRQRIIEVFKKIPCIKNCVGSMSLESSNRTMDYIYPDRNNNNSTRIIFEDNDFNLQSTAQLSTSDCKDTCDSHKICPEILPTTCDDYFNKKCSCTKFCKKTLRLMKDFVIDDGTNEENQLI